MIELIHQHASEIREICERRRVAKLELFGSAVTGSFNPAASDLDFLVAFRDLRPGEYADAYFGLVLDLQQLFGRNIDLVVDSAIRNPYFRQEIQATRSLLYAA